MVLSVLISVATFDIIPFIDDIQDFLFSFEYTTENNERDSYGWEALGYETKNFVKNSGSMFLIVVVFLILRLCENVSYVLAHVFWVWITIYKNFFES